MALSFSVVVHSRHQFGDEDQDLGFFAGREKSWSFDCPSVSSGHALLLFQSLGVSAEQILEVNGVSVFGGVPHTDPLVGAPFGGTAGAPAHGHLVHSSAGWTGNVLILNEGVLRDSGNVLRIASDGDEFVIDNVVVLYKTRSTGPVIGLPT